MTVLGLTFKEDVPDIRNSKVVDIIKELQDAGIAVQIHDPMADAHTAHEEYGVALTARKDLKPADAVVFAVKHKAFLADSWGLVQSLLLPGGGVVMDVKCALDRAKKPDNVILWRP